MFWCFFLWWSIARLDWLAKASRARRLDLFLSFSIRGCLVQLVFLAMVYSKKDRSSSQRWFAWEFCESEKDSRSSSCSMKLRAKRMQYRRRARFMKHLSSCLIALRAKRMQYRRRAQWYRWAEFFSRWSDIKAVVNFESRNSIAKIW